MIYLYTSVRFRKNVVARFSTRFFQAKPATQNLGGTPSRLAWVYSPDLDLSAGGLFGVQHSKVGGWGGGVVFY